MIAFVGVAALASAGAIASWFDTKQRRLPNWLALALLLAGLCYAALVGGLPQLGSHMLHAAIALCVGMALFAARVVGGGDAKYYAATAAWFSLSLGLQLLVWTALSGLVVLLVWSVLRRMKGKTAGFGSREQSDQLPYGVAIALAGVGLALVNL